MALEDIGKNVTSTFARALEAAIAVGEEAVAKKADKKKLMATRAVRAKQPPTPKKTSEQVDAEAKERLVEKRKKSREEARQRNVEIGDAKAQAQRDRGYTPSRDLPDLPESGPLETDEEIGFGGSWGQSFGYPDVGLKLVEDLVPDEERQKQAAELMAPKTEKFFDVLGLDEPPTDVLEEHEGFEQVMLDDSDEEGEPESLAEMKSAQAAQPPKAVRVLPDREKMESFFKKATKSSFNPNSKKDLDYMAKIKSLLEKNPGYADLSPGKFAMKLYAAG